MANFKKFNNVVNIEQFLIHLLNLSINYSKEQTKEETQKIVDEIIVFYTRLEQILDKSTTLELIKYTIAILSYRLPDFLQSKEDYNQNEFLKSVANKNNTLKGKVNKEDLTFWTRNCKNEIQVLCKSKYYETVNEIIFFYKKIGNIVYSICNDNNDKYLNEIFLHSEQIIQNKKEQMPNILSKMAEFKMSCWLDADKFMKDHKFF